MARVKKPSTVGDMVRSLAVILVPLVLITIVFTNVPKDHPVKVVDWRPVLTTARSEAPFPVLAPTNLPEGWRATKVSWVAQGRPSGNGQISPRNLWELGYLTPDDMYVGLAQGDLSPQDLIDQQTRKGTVDGETTVAGQTWQRRVSPDDRTRSLILSGPSATTIIAGDLPYEALEAYASTLSPTG